MRETIIAGNWKMNTLPADGADLASQIAHKTAGITGVTVVVCPPAPGLSAVAESVRNTHVQLGAQNVHWESSGAFTGEISAEMLMAIGCRWVITGHSERRRYFGETDECIAKRAAKAISSGLRPIVCIGETLDERNDELTWDVIRRQIKVGLNNVLLTGAGGLVIAYEPVWAIGTGLSATPDQAQEAHKFIRGCLADRFGREVAENTVIQYGGSVSDDNVMDLMECPDVDGALVGGASLKADKFAVIVQAASIK